MQEVVLSLNYVYQKQFACELGNCITHGRLWKVGGTMNAGSNYPKICIYKCRNNELLLQYIWSWTLNGKTSTALELNLTNRKLFYIVAHYALPFWRPKTRNHAFPLPYSFHNCQCCCASKLFLFQCSSPVRTALQLFTAMQIPQQCSCYRC